MAEGNYSVNRVNHGLSGPLHRWTTPSLCPSSSLRGNAHPRGMVYLAGFSSMFAPCFGLINIFEFVLCITLYDCMICILLIACQSNSYKTYTSCKSRLILTVRFMLIMFTNIWLYLCRSITFILSYIPLERINVFLFFV